MARRKPKKITQNSPSSSREVLEATPVESEKQRDVARIVSAEYKESFFAGPLPPPEILQRYNEIVPGSAKQIVDIFNAQSHHRMSLEKKVVGGDSLRAYIGLGCGFAVCLANFYLAQLLIVNGHGVSGALLSGVNLVGLVSVFVYGTQMRKQERVEKEEVRRKTK